jgi:hypothetical protein
MRPDADVRVRAAALRNVITINQLVPTDPPTYGAAGPVLTWQPFAVNVRSMNPPDRTSDTLRDGQGQTLTYTPIVIRYLPGVQANMQVVDQSDGAVYTIQGIVDFDKRRWLVELQCVEFGNNQ